MPEFSYERRLPYPREPVFDLVADVERYPEFLPGWRSSRIVDRSGDRLTVEQTLGGRGFQWRFRTTAALDRPAGIRIETREHPFEFLDQRWRFEAVGDHATRVTLDAAYELRGLPLRRLVALVFDEGFRRTLRAFEARARDKLG